MEGPGQYKLQDPIQRSDSEAPLEVLDLDIPRAKHMAVLSGSPTGAEMILLLVKITKQPKSVIEEMTARDLKHVFERLEPFF